MSAECNKLFIELLGHNLVAHCLCSSSKPVASDFSSRLDAQERRENRRHTCSQLAFNRQL